MPQPQVPCSLLLVLIFYTLLAAGLALQNITIVAPVGTSQHGDSHLLCVPTQAFDILVFFGANYVAHAATVRAYPGESAFNLGWGVVAAMLLPTSGMFRGSSAILRARFGSSRSPSPLELAARCGALCMVVRTKDWKPVAGDRLTQVAVTKRDSRRAYHCQELSDIARPWAKYPDMFPAFYIDPMFYAQHLTRQMIKNFSYLTFLAEYSYVLYIVFTGSTLVPVEEVVEMESYQGDAEPNSGQDEGESVVQHLLSRMWQMLGQPRTVDSAQDGEQHEFQGRQPSFLTRMCADLTRRESIDRNASLKWLRSKATRKIPDDPLAHTPLSGALNPHHTETSSNSLRTCTIATHRTYIPRWLKNIVGGLVLPDTITVTTGDRKINGHQMLPDGYAFAFVPSNAKVVPLDDGDRPTVPPPQISVTKGLIALGQAGYAFFTLYTARGDQITRYGYSAPGLSVLPYAFMSTVNLVAALLSPDYAGLYLVQSDTLLEASARPGANFEGVVGKLLPVTTGPTDSDIPCFSENVFEGVIENRGEDGGLQIELGGFAFSLATGPDQECLAIEIPACGEFQRNTAIPTETIFMSPMTHFVVANMVLLVIFLLMVGTGSDGRPVPFAGTDSTLFQRIVMPLWLLSGPIYGLWAAWGQFRFSSDIRGLTTKTTALVVGGVPALLGFGAVAQILLKYGNCISYA